MSPPLLLANEVLCLSTPKHNGKSDTVYIYKQTCKQKWRKNRTMRKGTYYLQENKVYRRNKGDRRDETSKYIAVLERHVPRKNILCFHVMKILYFYNKRMVL